MWLAHVAFAAERELLRWQGVRRNWVPTPAGRMCVYDAVGRGPLPPIVLLHGVGARSGAMRSLIAPFRQQFKRVLVPDLPGHGDSEGPELPLSATRLFEALTTQLDVLLAELEPVVLLGNSLGGGAALRYANLRPTRIRALILVSPGGAPMTPAELDRLLATFRLPTVAAAQEFVKLLFHRVPLMVRILPVARVVKWGLELPAIRSFLDSVTVADLLRAEELQQVQMPTQVLWGKSDRLLPRSNLDFFRQHLPPDLAEFAEPQGWSHSPQNDQPRQVAEMVTEFVRRRVATQP